MRVFKLRLAPKVPYGHTDPATVVKGFDLSFNRFLGGVNHVSH
jgi:hypothetical protein